MNETHHKYMHIPYILNHLNTRDKSNPSNWIKWHDRVTKGETTKHEAK